MLKYYRSKKETLAQISNPFPFCILWNAPFLILFGILLSSFAVPHSNFFFFNWNPNIKHLGNVRFCANFKDYILLYFKKIEGSEALRPLRLFLLVWILKGVLPVWDPSSSVCVTHISYPLLNFLTHPFAILFSLKSIGQCWVIWLYSLRLGNSLNFNLNLILLIGDEFVVILI